MFDLEDFPVDSWVQTPSGRLGIVVKHLHWQRGETRHDVRIDRALIRFTDGDTARLIPDLLKPAVQPSSIPRRVQLAFDFA